MCPNSKITHYGRKSMNILSLRPQTNAISPLAFKGEHKKEYRIIVSRRPACTRENSQGDTFKSTMPQKTVAELKRGQLIDNGQIFTRPTTEMFRGDLSWKYFANYIQERFCRENKVNTYIYACSNGSEAYSMSILLQEKFKDDAQKFFPIIAKDINEEAIQKNKINQLIGKIRTINGINHVNNIFSLSTQEKEEYFYDWTNGSKNPSIPSIEKLTKKATSPVEFSYGNILEDIQNIDNKKPSIVMCRNMWPYVNPHEYQNFANRLYHRLAPGSIVVLGEYDFKGEQGRTSSDKFPKALYNAGFKKPGDFTIFNNDLIFEKNGGGSNEYYGQEQNDRIEQFFQRLQRRNI